MTPAEGTRSGVPDLKRRDAIRTLDVLASAQNEECALSCRKGGTSGVSCTGVVILLRYIAIHDVWPWSRSWPSDDVPEFDPAKVCIPFG